MKATRQVKSFLHSIAPKGGKTTLKRMGKKHFVMMGKKSAMLRAKKKQAEKTAVDNSNKQVVKK